MISSAEELFAETELRTKVLKVHGREITIRELSLAGRQRLEQAKWSKVVLIKEGLIAPDGTPILKTDEEATRMLERSADFFDTIAAEILTLSQPPQKKE